MLHVDASSRLLSLAARTARAQNAAFRRDLSALRRNNQWPRLPHRGIRGRHRYVSRPDRAGARRLARDDALLRADAIRSGRAPQPVADAQSRPLCPSGIVARMRAGLCRTTVLLLTCLLAAWSAAAQVPQQQPPPA